MFAAGGLWLPVLHNLARPIEDRPAARTEVGAATLPVAFVFAQVNEVVLLMHRLRQHLIGEFVSSRYYHCRAAWWSSPCTPPRRSSRSP